MGLHSAVSTERRPRIEISDPDNEEDEETEAEERGECPECGTRSYQQLVRGNYSQWMYYTFGLSRYVDYDGLDTEPYNDTDGWECDNGHRVTESIEERLMEL